MIPELDTDPERETPNEWTMVERPLLKQLTAMGWEYLQGDIDYPQKTFRERFRDVLLRDQLRAAILRINAAEKLDEITIDRAIRELERSDKPEGLARNRELTDKLIRGVSVHRAVGGDGSHSRNVTVRFIDFDPVQSEQQLLSGHQPVPYRLYRPGGFRHSRRDPVCQRYSPGHYRM